MRSRSILRLPRFRSPARQLRRIRQFACGGRRAPNKFLVLLYDLARLKHDRQAEIRFNPTEAMLQRCYAATDPF